MLPGPMSMKTLVRFFSLLKLSINQRKYNVFYTLVSWTTHENSEKIGHSVGNLTIFCLIFRDNGKVQLDNL